MSQLTSTKHSELLNTQTNAKKTNKENSSTELVKMEKIHGTPFTAVLRDEKYYIIMGKYRMNEEPLNTMDEVYEFLENEMWNVMTAMMVIISGDTLENHLRSQNRDTTKKG